MCHLCTFLFLINMAMRLVITTYKKMPRCVLLKSLFSPLLDFTMGHNYFWFSGQYYFQGRGVAMGVKFAPSMANLFITKWEEDVIYKEYQPQLVLWKRYRYIDYALLLWDTDFDTLDWFVQLLNANHRLILLTHEASRE